MNAKFILSLIVCSALLCLGASAQDKAKSFDELKTHIESSVRATNLDEENTLVSGKAMNLFIQRKVSTYLAGSSEISLSKAYATYTSESDKLTFGFNFPVVNSDDERLRSLFNPLIETDIKNNFATLYKKDEWQSNIRLGFKFSYFFPSIFGLPATTINFYGLESPHNQKSKMIRKRSQAAQTILDMIKKEETSYTNSPSAMLIETRDDLKKKYEAEKASLQGDQSEKALDRIVEIDKILNSLDALQTNEPFDFDKKLQEYENELAKAEVDALYEQDSYTWSQTLWMSLWGFLPVTESKQFIAENNTQKFEHQKFKPWEANVQINYLRDGSWILLVSPGLKIFQNNSALAELMTSVDYNQYLQFPGADTANAAILQTNKAFIGLYDEFVTSNFNLQIVIALSDRKTKKGGERFLTPGISIRFEKNFGDFSAVNWRFGLPLRFKAKDKEKAVNVEPQVRLNNTNNYANKVNYKVQPTFGVNVGLPFTTLFKG